MFFVKTRNTQIVIVITALVAFFPGGYMAQAASTTNLTFVVNPYTGGLAINVPTTGNLGSLASPDTDTAVTAQIESVTVTDTRRGGLVRLWDASVISTDLLTGTDSLTATTIGYSAGIPTIISGTVGMTEHTRSNLSATIKIQSGSSTLGNHVVSWRPTLSIGLKPGQSAGTYVGVLTHSVA
jgi:hypothetical protein